MVDRLRDKRAVRVLFCEEDVVESQVESLQYNGSQLESVTSTLLRVIKSLSKRWRRSGIVRVDMSAIVC